MATANPAMNEEVYRRAGVADTPTRAMTVQGTVLKTVVLLVILLVTLVWMYLEILRLLAKLRGGNRD